MRYAWVLALIMAALPLAGCINPADLQGANLDSNDVDAEQAADWATEIPDAIAGLAPLAHAADVATGSGIWLDGDHAYVSARNQGMYVVDVSTPESPTVVSQLSTLPDSEDPLYARDADVAHVGERTIVALSGANQGIHLVDATNPASPWLVATIGADQGLEHGSHNLAVHPTMPQYLYNSRSDGQGGAIELFDISVPEEPVLALSFGGYGCHDITFFVDAEKSRLYCPGIQLTEIWDIADVMDPKLVVQIENEAARSYGLGLHHSAMTKDGKVLIIGDEFMGGGGPGCHANAADQASTTSGALWFYDVTDEANPALLSHISPNAPVDQYAARIVANGVDPSNPTATPFRALGSTSCTTHFGDFVPDHDMLVIGWYMAGVIIVDFSNPASPTIVDQWNDGTNTWDVRIHNGYMFTGDIARGLDVLEFVAG